MAAPPLDAGRLAKLAESLHRHGGNKAAACRETGLSYNTVLRYMHLWAAGGGPAPAVDDGRSNIDEVVRAAVEKVLAARAAADGKDTPEIAAAKPATLPAPGYTRVVTPERKYERVAFVSDIHHPFHDAAALAVVLAALRDYRPELLILGGDQFDCYAISDHDREPGRCDFIQDEFDAAQPTWKEFDSLGCDVIWIDGNHEERIVRMQHRNPGLFNLRALEIPLAAELPKRWTYCPNQTRIKLGSLTALHGDTKGRGTASVHAAAGMLRKLRTSCIAGHLHRFQTFMETTESGVYRAGFANGHLCDVNMAKYITSPDWQQGFTTIDFDWSCDLFCVVPHLIVRGRMRWGDRTYG